MTQEFHKAHIAMVSPNGTSGDVRPMLAVAEDLTSRGHRVSFLANPQFQELVGSAGANFVPVGTIEAQRNLLEHPNVYAGPRALSTFVNEMVLPNVPAIARQLRDLARKDPPDVIFSHGVALGSQATARSLDIPAISAAYSPMVWPGEPAVQPHLPGLRIPHWAAPFMYRVASLAASALFDFKTRTAYREANLEFKIGEVTRELTGGQRHLGMWSPHFRAPSKRDPAHFQTTGFAHFDRDFSGNREISDGTRQFLLDHQNVVVFTLGTGVVHGADKRAFYQQACEACRLSNVAGLLLIGKEENRPAAGDLGPGLHVSLYEPLSMVFESASLVVHQGGIGTTAEVLRAGVPHIIIPSAYDQHDTADRIANRLLIGGKLTWAQLCPETLSLEMDRIRRDFALVLRASGLGAQIRNEQGDTTAANAILRVAR
ncbi:MAG: glycosyltransferase [Oligoflexia bacterium]|nr:glycosyltransferase [Oligoflexia bacterium]